MRFDPEKHRRRSIRLRDYDYGQKGAYFVTVCTHNREIIFGDIVDSQMQLNDAGRFVEQRWLDIPNHFPHAELDAFVVMPNHLHGIILITDTVGANNHSPLQDVVLAVQPPFRSPSRTIGSIIRGFKIGVGKWFRSNMGISVVWQRNYYDHVIRNNESLNLIREYIENNPAQWALDRENPAVDPGVNK